MDTSDAPRKEQPAGVFERAFEQVLWASRLFLLPAVGACVALTAGLVYITTVDALHLLGSMLHYASSTGHGVERVALLTGIIKVIDGYLLAGIVLIFGLGLYELFISTINLIERSEVASRLLLIRTLDDLKDRLAKVVLLVLVIEFFQRALSLSYATAQDLLYLAIGIALMGVALYVAGRLGH
jgi:uncharacterized membrane protein YqhA